MWVINPAAGCHYCLPGLQLPPQPLRGLLQFCCLVNRGTMGVNSLPMTVTRQRRDCDLNPDPSAPESSTLTTRLPWIEADRTYKNWLPRQRPLSDRQSTSTSLTTIFLPAMLRYLVWHGEKSLQIWSKARLRLQFVQPRRANTTRYTEGAVTSQYLWLRYDRHFVGTT